MGEKTPKCDPYFLHSALKMTVQYLIFVLSSQRILTQVHPFIYSYCYEVSLEEFKSKIL